MGVESDRSSVCHPEIAGEDTEFNWGWSKVYCWAQSNARKQFKDKFYTLVDESLGPAVITLTLCCNNTCRARSYMLAYKALEDTYKNED